MGDKTGNSPLHLVTSPEEAKELILAGANVNAVDNVGHTPLHLAHNGAVARVLIENNARLDSRDGFGWTPVLRAAHTGRISALQELIHAGADVNIEGLFARGSLHRAKNASVVDALLGAGADLERRSGFLKTPLAHVTCSITSDVSAMLELIQRGAYFGNLPIPGTDDKARELTRRGIPYGARKCVCEIDVHRKRAFVLHKFVKHEWMEMEHGLPEDVSRFLLRDVAGECWKCISEYTDGDAKKRKTTRPLKIPKLV